MQLKPSAISAEVWNFDRPFLPGFRSCKHILSKLDLAPVNFHNSKCLAMKLIQYTYKFK